MGGTSALRLESTVRRCKRTRPVPVSRQNLPRAAVLKNTVSGTLASQWPFYFLINFYWPILALQVC